jgi:integrase
MASITQYRGKTWRAVVRRTGFPVQSKTFDKKSDARAWAASIESRLGVGTQDRLQLKQATVTTCKDVFQRYLDEVGVNQKGKNATNILRRLMRDAAFMRTRFDRVTANDIRDWRDARVLQIKPSSVHRELNTLSGVFTHAIKEWSMLLPANPCKSVSRFKGADVPREKVWRPQDVQAFLKAAKWQEDVCPVTGRDYTGWALLLGVETAMRMGEMCLPTVADFHRELRFVHLEDTKNGDSRDVPLSTKAMAIMDMLCAGKRLDDKIIPINANTLGEYMLDVRKTCGLEHLVQHDARHTAATALSKKLPNVLELAAVTGHRSLKSLKRYYHPDPTEMAGKLG